jgi:hypothetical protein
MSEKKILAQAPALIKLRNTWSKKKEDNHAKYFGVNDNCRMMCKQ